jgi:predicted Zn-dependent protease
MGAHFFEVLDRQMKESGAALPGWLSTHPDPGDRVERTRKLAREEKAGVSGPLTVGEAEHKAEIDGVVFGVDPRQGYVEGSVFLHPEMQFAVTYPQGWTIQNTPSAVVAGDDGGSMQVQLTLEDAQGAGTEEAIRRVAANARAEIVSLQTRRIGGYPAHEAVLSVESDGDTQQVLITCIQRRAEEGIFRFLGFARSFASATAVLQDVAGSFRDLTDVKKLRVQPLRVRVEVMPRSQTLRDVVQGSAMPVDVGTVALLNNLQAESRLAEGFRLKTVQGTRPGAD